MAKQKAAGLSSDTIGCPESRRPRIPYKSPIGISVHSTIEFLTIGFWPATGVKADYQFLLKKSGMTHAARQSSFGILAISGILVGFRPFLDALNWPNIPFAGVGVIVAAIALGTTRAASMGKSVAGLTCCGIALFFGIIRLALGRGIL